MTEQELDRILGEMRGEEAPPDVLSGAQERVWEKLQSATHCAGFQEQFADFHGGRLNVGKRLLLEDHLSRCPACRRALAGEQNRTTVLPLPFRRPAGMAFFPWAVAAGVMLLGVYAGRERLDEFFAPSGPGAVVQAAGGGLYRASGGTLPDGAPLGAGEAVRTGRGHRAMLRLTDGSTVEVNENTELLVRSAWSGQTIHLERGDVIVHAAKQRRGSLRVLTRDSVATVKGTVFAVSTGAAGSVVGVVEGSVAVEQPGTQRTLLPGERAASSSALAKISVRDTVGWSPRAAEYLAVLGELAAIEKQLTPPAPRTDSRLLAVLPASVMLYGALPNPGGAVEQAVHLIEQRSAASPALSQWWASPEAAPLQKLSRHVRAIAPALGGEIVVALLRRQEGPGLPLLLAEVQPGRDVALQQALAALPPSGDMPLAYRIQDGLLVLSDSPERLAAALQQLGTGGVSPFTAEIARRYQRGVSWLFAADLPALTGNTQLRYAFYEERQVQGVAQNEAAISFPGPRQGIFSWLAPPAPAGSAEYVSSEAILAFSVATRHPRQIVDELATGFGGESPLIHLLGELDKTAGSQVSADIAASIGTDYTLALETAAITDPGWFAAFEVYRPELLTSSLQRLVQGFNREGAGAHPVSLTEETADGRTWYTLQRSGHPGQVQWTFDRGYALLGMSRTQLLRAIATRAGGFPLLRTAAFRDRLPVASGLHHSGFLWVNVGGAYAAIAERLGDDKMKQLFALREPALITFTGEAEQIASASRTRISSMLMDTLLATRPHDARN